MKTATTIHCMVVMALGLLPGNVRGQTLSLPVSQDSYIDGNNQNSNYGQSTSLQIGHNVTGGQRPYLLFDASVFGADEINRVEGLRFTLAFNVSRSFGIYLITGENQITGNVDNWLENGITYLNAPGNNNGTTISRNFLAYPGETVTLLGSVSYTAGTGSQVLFPLTEGSAGEIALLEALNTGDRRATIGLRWNSSQNETRAILSREYQDGAYAPTLLVVIPEPGTHVLLLGGSALLFAARRRLQRSTC